MGEQVSRSYVIARAVEWSCCPSTRAVSPTRPSVILAHAAPQRGLWRSSRWTSSTFSAAAVHTPMWHSMPWASLLRHSKPVHFAELARGRGQGRFGAPRSGPGRFRLRGRGGLRARDRLGFRTGPGILGDYRRHLGGGVRPHDDLL